MKKLFLLYLMIFGSLVIVNAQQQISGTMIDSYGEPLIGANVLEKGSTNGTITDIDGSFSFRSLVDNPVLIFSYIGFKTVEIQYDGTPLNVIMVNDNLIDEVVVVGYGEQDRESITGAVSSVSAKEFENRPIATVDQLLQGQAPGLVVLGGTGQPGEDAGSVVLRGPSSITGSNTPIYIMDGIQISSEDFGALNPNDIESVSVLRDASSAAIYGASGANGVILITTKSGEAGESKVQYNFQYGKTSRTQDRFEMMNAAEKLAFEEIARRGPGWNLSPNNPANEGLPQEDLDINKSQLDSLAGINTNWRDLIFRTGVIQEHNLRVSGGDENTKYYFSGNYYDEEGQVLASNFNRSSLRMNIEETVSDRFKIGVRATGGYSTSKFASSVDAINLNNPFALAYLMNPYEQIYDANGDYQFGSTGRNPFEQAELNYTKQAEFKGISNLYASFKLMDGLTLKGNWGIDHTGTNITTFTDPESRLGSTSEQGNQGSLDKDRRSTTNITLSHIAEYQKLIEGRHNLTFIVGQEMRKRWIDYFNFDAFGLSGGLISPAGTTAGSVDNPDFIPTIGGLLRQRTLLSFFSRANYTLDDKYNVTLGARRDGSSVFGANKKWGTFWNVGASWIVSREDFMKDVNAINYLKFGISYGTNGNSEGIGERELAALFTNGDYAGSTAFLPDRANPGNPDLQWEVLKGMNVLLEFGLFDNFVSGNVNYYNNKTESLFIDQKLPPSNGVDGLTINAGSMKNEGIEVELDFNLLRGDFSLSIGGQVGYNNNTITDLGQVSEFEQGTSIVEEGLPLGSHYVVEWGGVNPLNGNPLYVDDDGNLTEDFASANPKAIFGTNYAPWNGGVNLDASYKNLSLSVFGNFVQGNVLFNNQSFFQENPNFSQFNLSTIMNTIWQEPGDITEVQRIGTPRQFTSKDLEDASFFRLRLVQLSYNVPIQGRLIDAISNLNVFVQGKNLLTITDFTGFDPEDSNNLASYGFPSARAFTFGLGVTF